MNTKDISSISPYCPLWLGFVGLGGGFAAELLNVFYGPLWRLYLVAALTFILAFGGGLLIIKKSGRAVAEMSVPLVCGAVIGVCLSLYGMSWLLLPLSLIFYGLFLFMVSRDAGRYMKIISLVEILLGLVSLFTRIYSMLFWLVGFVFIHWACAVILRVSQDKAQSSGKMQR